MTPEHTNKLREEWQEEFGGDIHGWRDGIITPEEVADWWLAKVAEAHTRGVREGDRGVESPCD